MKKLFQLVSFMVLLFCSCRPDTAREKCAKKRCVTVYIYYFPEILDTCINGTYQAKKDTFCFLPQEIVTKTDIISEKYEYKLSGIKYNGLLIDMQNKKTEPDEDHIYTLTFMRDSSNIMTVAENMRSFGDELKFQLHGKIELNDKGDDYYYVQGSEKYSPITKYRIQFTPRFKQLLKNKKYSN
jgi:hypothetical protein